MACDVKSLYHLPTSLPLSISLSYTLHFQQLIKLQLTLSSTYLCVCGYIMSLCASVCALDSTSSALPMALTSSF